MRDSFGPLFSQTTPDAEHTYGVLELNEAIAAALERSFPGEIWLRGEIQGLSRTRARKHWYFELVEKEPGRDQLRSSVSIALLSWNRAGVDRELARARGFELDDGLEVRIRCKVSYYAPWGKLQLTMVGVDPEFTLGKLAQNRERILRALSAEGLLERNAKLPLPMPPLRIGLVTSLGSAAYNDFVQELRRSGFAFVLLACDVRVQGTEAEAQIVQALRTLARRKPDLMALIRGGGSRGDLAAFDSEAIARAIALSPVPVWTGIGHEIDTSVADAVAHRSFKTPTAVAAALVEAVQACVSESEELFAAVVRAARERTTQQRVALHRFGRELIRGTRALLRAHRERLVTARRSVGRQALRSAQRRRQLLERHEGRLAELARLRSVQEEQRLLALQQRLPQVRRRLREASQRVDGMAARVRALDPQRVLARGYSLTWSAGRLVRLAQELSPGAQLRTELLDGAVESRVESIQLQPKEGA